jgi:hypothetical protein
MQLASPFYRFFVPYMQRKMHCRSRKAKHVAVLLLLFLAVVLGLALYYRSTYLTVGLAESQVTTSHYPEAKAALAEQGIICPVLPPVCPAGQTPHWTYSVPPATQPATQPVVPVVPPATQPVVPVVQAGSSSPGPTRSLPPPGTQFYGYWYSHYCDVGNVSGCPRSCVTKTYTAAGELQQGLMTVESMVAYAKNKTNLDPGKADPYAKYTGINTTASLGIGAPPSNGTASAPYTWKDLLCEQSDKVQEQNARFNIVNIGGWGSKAAGPILWQRSDVDISDSDIDAICDFMDQNNFRGISFDLEGLSSSTTESWDSSDPDSNASLLNQACGKIQSRGFMAWIVIPAFNVRKEHGGPLKITDWNNITLVQLMCYGKGLDSLWGGDPSGAPMTAQQVEDVVDVLLTQKNANKEKIMLAFSYNTGGYSKPITPTSTAKDAEKQKTSFRSMVNGPGQKATAGCMAWCKGNTQSWIWAGAAVQSGNLGTCDKTKTQGGSGGGAYVTCPPGSYDGGQSCPQQNKTITTPAGADHVCCKL